MENELSKECNPCSQINLLMEMAGDVKVLVSEFKAMNGSLRETRLIAEKHQSESIPYRDKINIIWSAIHTVKWAIVLIFGSGLVWRVMEYFIK